MRDPPTLPSAVHANPDAQPPWYRHELTHASPAWPGNVTGDEQFTAGGGGTENASKFMCCASLHRLTGFPAPSQCHSVGVDPPGMGPHTSAGRAHSPPTHDHGASGAARCGQSELVVQPSVHPPTRSVLVSHAAGTMHSPALPASQYASAFTQTFTCGLPMPMHP